MDNSDFYYKTNHNPPVVYNEFKDFNGWTVGGIRGWPTTDAFKKAGLILTPFDSHEAGQGMLRAGRIQLLEGHEFTVNFILNNQFSNQKQNFIVVPKPTSNTRLSLVYKKGDLERDAMVEKFKTGFDIILKNGVYRKVLERYWVSINLSEEMFDF